VLSADEVAVFRAAIKVEVGQAAAEADGCPQPATTDLLAHIYSDQERPVEVRPNYLAETPVTMIDAINHGLHEEMVRNSKIVMCGEDIADPKGGVFGVTRGLSTDFPGRVFNAPLAEASIAGVATGMAIAGYKPIIEIHRGLHLAGIYAAPQRNRHGPMA
jgi:2-oxoisovalerate dehydrogenase E1 component